MTPLHVATAVVVVVPTALVVVVVVVGAEVVVVVTGGAGFMVVVVATELEVVGIATVVDVVEHENHQQCLRDRAEAPVEPSINPLAKNPAVAIATTFDRE